MFSLNWNRYENKSTPFRVKQPGTQTENQMIPGNGWQTWVSTYVLFRHLFIVFADHWRNVIRARTPFTTVPPARLICVPGEYGWIFCKEDPPHTAPLTIKKSLGVSKFKFENGNLPPSTAWGCKLLGFVISQLLLCLIPSSSCNPSRDASFPQGVTLLLCCLYEEGTL